MVELSEELMEMNHQEEEAKDTTITNLIKDAIRDMNHQKEENVDITMMINPLDPPIAQT
jgi:osmotically-inducible protein OsmY